MTIPPPGAPLVSATVGRKKTDVGGRPAGIGHVGVLGKGPPGTAGLPLI